MINRRRFLQISGGMGSAFLASETMSVHKAAASAMGVDFDKAAAARELAAHRIVKITARQVRDRYPRSIGPNSRVDRWAAAGRIGFVPWRPTKAPKAGPCAIFRTRRCRNSSACASAICSMSRRVRRTRPAALDKALHDLAGNILGLPVWKLIGAAGPGETLLYSGAIYMEDVWPPDAPRGIPAVLAACQQDYDAGYRAFKLKIGRGFKWMPRQEGLQRDIDVTRAVKETVPRLPNPGRRERCLYGRRSDQIRSIRRRL